MEIRTIPDLLTRLSFLNKPNLFTWKEDGAWVSLSSGAFVQRVEELAHSLRLEHHVEKGDRVGIFIYNGAEWHIARMACAEIGAVSVPILTEFSNDDLRTVFRKAKMRLILTKDEALEKKALTILEDLEEHTHVVRYSLGELAEAARTPQDYHRVHVEPDDLAMIFFTSGTTSDPKGVMHTHGSILSNILDCRTLFPFSEADVVLSFLPAGHIFQQAVDTTALLVGGTIASVEKREHVRSAITEIEPSCMAAVPRMFELIAQGAPLQIKRKLAHKNMLLQKLVPLAIDMGQKRYSDSLSDRLLARTTSPLLKLIRRKVRRETFGKRMRFFVSGGAPLAPHVGAFIQGGLETPICQGYGMTEMAGAGTCNTLEHNILGSCGRPIPGLMFSLDPLSEDMRANFPVGSGEIVARGSSIMSGYFEDEHATNEVMEGEWLRTGDIGFFDETGALWIAGRKKEMLVLRNGLKVMAQTLEDKVRAHCPYIEQIVISLNRDETRLVALIYPNKQATKERLGDGACLSNGTWSESARSFIQTELRNLPLAQHEKITSIYLLGEPLSPEQGTLTPSLKPKRGTITEKYGPAFEQL